MNLLQQVLQAAGSLLRWWFIVLPWEQAIRVRFGKHVKSFGAGLHFQIPFVDRLYLQNTRRRIASIHIQTISTNDGKTLTLAGSLSYRIEDIELLYRTLHQAEGTIMQMVQGLVSDYVVSHDLVECAPGAVAGEVTQRLNLSRYGLGDAEFFLTDFAVVRTFRLLNDTLSRYMGDELRTDHAAVPGAPR